MPCVITDADIVHYRGQIDFAGFDTHCIGWLFHWLPLLAAIIIDTAEMLYYTQLAIIIDMLTTIHIGWLAGH